MTDRIRIPALPLSAADGASAEHVQTLSFGVGSAAEVALDCSTHGRKAKLVLDNDLTSPLPRFSDRFCGRPASSVCAFSFAPTTTGCGCEAVAATEEQQLSTAPAGTSATTTGTAADRKLLLATGGAAQHVLCSCARADCTILTDSGVRISIHGPSNSSPPRPTFAPSSTSEEGDSSSISERISPVTLAQLGSFFRLPQNQVDADLLHRANAAPILSVSQENEEAASGFVSIVFTGAGFVAGDVWSWHESDLNILQRSRCGDGFATGIDHDHSNGGLIISADKISADKRSATVKIPVFLEGSWLEVCFGASGTGVGDDVGGSSISSDARRTDPSSSDFIRTLLTHGERTPAVRVGLFRVHGQADCLLSEWQPATPCNSPCGQGTENLLRQVLRPAWSGSSGRKCPTLGKDLKKERACVVRACPSGAGWGVFSEQLVGTGSSTEALENHVAAGGVTEALENEAFRLVGPAIPLGTRDVFLSTEESCVCREPMLAPVVAKFDGEGEQNRTGDSVLRALGGADHLLDGISTSNSTEVMQNFSSNVSSTSIMTPTPVAVPTMQLPSGPQCHGNRRACAVPPTTPIPVPPTTPIPANPNATTNASSTGADPSLVSGIDAAALAASALAPSPAPAPATCSLTFPPLKAGLYRICFCADRACAHAYNAQPPAFVTVQYEIPFSLARSSHHTFHGTVYVPRGAALFCSYAGLVVCCPPV